MPLALAVDVGNTRAKFGVFEVGSATRPQVIASSAVQLHATNDVSSAIREWLNAVGVDEITSSIVAGSNPPARDRLLESWPLHEIHPRVVAEHSEIPIAVDVDAPQTIGIDRLLTAYAACELFTAEQPVIVIDSGTATTVNLTTADRVFRGGAILPGLRLSAHALHDYTARLPMIETDQLSSGPTQVDAPLPGRNTIDAMKSGLFWGQLGAIRELAARLAIAAAKDFGDQQTPLLVLTGGGGRQLVNHLPKAIYIDSLALHGLALLCTG